MTLSGYGVVANSVEKRQHDADDNADNGGIMPEIKRLAFRLPHPNRPCSGFGFVLHALNRPRANQIARGLSKGERCVRGKTWSRLPSFKAQQAADGHVSGYTSIMNID